MTNDIMPTTPVNDGFDGETDDYRSGIIRGLKLKFKDEWTCGDEVIEPDRELVAIENMKVLQKWLPDQRPPAETIILGTDEKFPDVDALNAEAPREEWREVFGKLKGPWEKARVLYLLDQETMKVFTYVGSTVGGEKAVRELRESTRLARKLQGAPVLPIITLTETFMPTEYGGRQRPAFKVKRFMSLGTPAIVAPAPKQLEHAGQEAGAVIAPPAGKKKAAAKKAPVKKAPPKIIKLNDDDGDDDWGEDE